MKKVKPNKITGLTGNSFAFKFNLRFDAAESNIKIESIINPESNFWDGYFC